jgi:hypothetical protein
VAVHGTPVVKSSITRRSLRRCLTCGIEPGQETLQPQDSIKKKGPTEAKQHKRGRVLLPVHLLLFIDSGDSIQETFYGLERRIQQRPLSLEHTGHVAAKWLDQQREDQQESTVLDQCLHS